MASDVYNLCGGSAYKLPSGNYLVAFTAMDQLADAARQHNTSAPRAAYAWELALDTPGARGPTVKTTFKLPISHRDAGEQNGYRVVPWHSILGESTTYPFETFGDDDSDDALLAAETAPRPSDPGGR